MATKTKKNGNGKTTDQIYQEVTNTIIAALEQGTVPWHRPWRVDGGVHMNLKNKRAYRGVNQFLLDFSASLAGYRSPYWLTFKQAQELGGSVRKGEKSTLVVFWKILTVDKRDTAGNVVTDDTGRIVKTKIPLLKYYRVFNVEQCDGIPEDKIPVMEKPEDFNPIEAAQAIIDLMPKRPEIHHRGGRAFYRPASDEVTLPEPEQFDSPEHYYLTAYHELVHSTGHEDRLHRVKDWTMFGSDPYAKEELVAEMGAAMLAGFAEINMPTVENSAAYIASWLKRFKDDKKLVVQAASKAQQAADFILGDTFGNNEEGGE